MASLSNSISKGLLHSPELREYMLETFVYPREPELLKEIRLITSNNPSCLMATAPEDGHLIALLLKLTNAKKTIEIGVFTEYSLVLNALTIPDNGKIIAIDLDRDAYEMESPIIKKANIEHKINFIQSSALSALDELLNEVSKKIFDFPFIDGDKVSYQKYHERMLELVKVGGIIVYDNTLWFETVAMPEEYVKETMKPNRQHIIEFNKFLDSDTRVQISQVPTGDGITICWRL
ncbi:cation-dependent phenylpropanoid and flavonoid 8-O-methyltransferase 1-like [Solanum lycopersicum]|uniref:cation-dependent phenylpropanoid and flavonoid 8-O-methyltransferase 1-like n=1 Tax=Solanum lycopersicum TaxID=4081 RepID=UPI003747AF95